MIARGEQTGWQSTNDFLDWTSGCRELGALLGDAVAAMLPSPPEEGVYLTA